MRAGDATKIARNHKVILGIGAAGMLYDAPGYRLQMVFLTLCYQAKLLKKKKYFRN